MTAISLIKQSKVAHDERCKILVSSLQDTLHGIEAKSYGSRRGNTPFLTLFEPNSNVNRVTCRAFEVERSG